MSETRNRKGKDRPNLSLKQTEEKGESRKRPSKLQYALANIKEQQSSGVMKHLMTAAKIIFAVMIVPPFLNYAALQREATVLKPEGELYDVGWGQKLFLSCKGTGAPTVVLDAPTGMNSDAWSLIVDRVAKYSRVCVYDRAGLGFSDRPLHNSTEADGNASGHNYRNRWFPFTGERMVDDLHTLLTQTSSQPKPFLLVGAELGALVAQFYTHMFENDVMGMILINPLSEDIFKQDKGIWLHNWYSHIIPSYQTIQLGAAIGITRLSIMLGYLQHPMHMSAALSETTVQRQKYLMCYPRHLSSMVDEHYFINETFSQFKTMKMIHQIPQNISVTVVTGNYYDEQMPGPLNKAWAKCEQNLITNVYPNSQHIVVNGGDRHMLYKKPDAIIDPIRRAVRNWQSKNSNVKTS